MSIEIINDKMGEIVPGNQAIFLQDTIKILLILVLIKTGFVSRWWKGYSGILNKAEDEFIKG